jgi:LysM repeat protein
MNSSSSSSPSPFSTAAQPRPARSRIKLAVFSVLGLNVIFCLILLLTPGCKRELPPEPQPEQPPIADTNLDLLMDTNVVVADPWARPGAAATNVVAQPQPQPQPQPPVAFPPFGEPAPQPVAGPSTYKIQSGDTFDAIARRHGTTASAIAAANPGVDPRRLKIGSTINLPAPSAAAPTAPTAAVSGENIYVVKSGDTLSRIATQQGTTVKAIKQLNGLTTDRITVGQKLKIPAKAPAPVAPAPFGQPQPGAPVPTY